MTRLPETRISVFQTVTGQWAVTGPRVKITPYAVMSVSHCAFLTWTEAMEEANQRAHAVTAFDVARKVLTPPNGDWEF